MKPTFVIVTGNPVDGFEFYGPFADTIHACEVGNTDAHFSDVDWWTAEVHPVTEAA